VSNPQGPDGPTSLPPYQSSGPQGGSGPQQGHAPVAGPYGTPAQQPGPPHPGSPQGHQPWLAPSSAGGGGDAGAGGTGAGLGIASLVVGIASLLGAILLVGGLLGIVGAVLGVVSLVRGAAGRVPAIIGTAVSGLAMLISLVVLIVIVTPSGPQVESVSRAPVSATPSDAPSSEASAPVASPSGGPTASSVPPPPTNAAFGQRITYDDGLSVTVSGPEAYAVGAYASGADQAANVVFTIVVENGTGKNYEPLLYSTVSSGGVEASQIYGDDVESSGPSTTIPAGQSTTYREAYSIADPGAVVFDLRVGSFWRNAVYQL
jgi:hypothetical protein